MFLQQLGSIGRHQGGFVCNNARYLLYTFAWLCPHEDATSSRADIFSLTCASLVTLDMHCDRPPKMEKSIWVVITVRSDHTKKFLGAKSKISI